MAKRVKWKWNVAGFAQLRNHPVLVAAMEDAALAAADSSPIEVQVEVWKHEGRKRGGRTSVQIWAYGREAMRAVSRDPGQLTALLAQTGFRFQANTIYVTKAGKPRVATQAQIDHWTRGKKKRG